MLKHVSRYPLPAADSIGDACESAASQLMSDILLMHAAVTLPLGGASGVLSYELLDSAAHRPFATFGGNFFYQTGLEQAAALFESLVLNHAFEIMPLRMATNEPHWCLACISWIAADIGEI